MICFGTETLKRETQVKVFWKIIGETFVERNFFCNFALVKEYKAQRRFASQMTGQDADIVRASLQIALYNKTWIIKPKNLNCDGKQEINIQLVGADPIATLLRRGWGRLSARTITNNLHTHTP